MPDETKPEGGIEPSAEDDAYEHTDLNNGGDGLDTFADDVNQPATKYEDTDAATLADEECKVDVTDPAQGGTQAKLAPEAEHPLDEQVSTEAADAQTKVEDDNAHLGDKYATPEQVELAKEEDSRTALDVLVGLATGTLSRQTGREFVEEFFPDRVTW